MLRVDFIVTNDGHHMATFLPIVDRLRRESRCECRILSLCELRGFRTPSSQEGSETPQALRLLPFLFRPSPRSGPALDSPVGRRLRWRLRAVLWRLLLRSRIASAIENTALAVLPNDGAFPYDLICRLLQRKGKTFLVMQEGIRYEVPDKTIHGRGGAHGYLVWGESSAAYYQAPRHPGIASIRYRLPPF